MKTYEEIRDELIKEIDDLNNIRWGAEANQLFAQIIKRAHNKLVDRALAKFDEATQRELQIGKHVSEAIRLSLNHLNKK